MFFNKFNFKNNFFLKFHKGENFFLKNNIKLYNFQDLYFFKKRRNFRGNTVIVKIINIYLIMSK